MESEIAIHTGEGRPEAQSALTALARALNINEHTLKTVLIGAFDLLAAVAGTPIFGLHLSLIRLSYCIDSKTLHEVVGTFRQTFNTTLDMARVNYSTTQAAPSQYTGAYRSPPKFAPSNFSVHMGQPQYSSLDLHS